MPHKSIVIRWLLANTKKKDDEGNEIAVPTYPEFRDHYRQAREIQYTGIGDELLDIADESSNDYMTRTLNNGEDVEVLNQEAIQRSKLRVDTRFKLLSKMLPHIYGDKVVHENTGSVDHKHHGTIEHKPTDGMNFEKVIERREKLRVINGDKV